jgi:transketolase
VEAQTTIGWHRILGDGGVAIGLDHFGESAPASELNELFGFSPDKLTARLLDAMK